jgi:5-formyltetrahydrofolate cyclo-ligase
MGMNISEIKKSLRKEMLQKRAEMAAVLKAQCDQKICEELASLVHQMNAQTVHAYIPFSGEIDIKPFLENMLHQNIQVVCPKTLPKRQLENRVLTSLDSLETGIMGTLHPKEPLLYNGSFDLIIVPGLAYDLEKYRLGYGGGYYDGFLGLHPKSLKVGIFYKFQQVAQVPREAHDLRLDELIIGL